MGDSWQIWIRPEDLELLQESWSMHPGTGVIYSPSHPIHLDEYKDMLTGFVQQPGYLERFYRAFTLGRLKSWLPKESHEAGAEDEAVPFVKISARNTRPGYIISPHTRAMLDMKKREQPEYQRIEVPSGDLFMKYVFDGYGLTLTGLKDRHPPLTKPVFHLLVYASPKSVRFASQ